MQKIARIIYNKENVSNYKAFVWYLTQYVHITNFDEKCVSYKEYSYSQKRFIRNKIDEYSEDMGIYNYEIEKQNDLWKTHNRNAEVNCKIIERLL